jgi:hypothetical protein
MKKLDVDISIEFSFIPMIVRALNASVERREGAGRKCWRGVEGLATIV